MTGYTKLFRKILQSTVWQESLETKVVWITMLALKDADGKVFSSLPGLAHTSGVSLEATKIAVEKFKAPDPFSSTKANDGRRVEEIEGGWFILNHWKYVEEMNLDDRKAYWATKQRESRARKNALSRRLKKRENQHMERVEAHIQAGEDELAQQELPPGTNGNAGKKIWDPSRGEMVEVK